MGSFLDKPKTEKETHCDNGNGMRAAVSAMQGWRVEMEDAHTVTHGVDGHPDYSFYAVFDGHGGSLISKTASEQLLKKVMATEHWKKDSTSIESLKLALRQGFLDVDEEMRKLPAITRGEDHSGSTAIAALVTPTHIIVANSGDSRSVLVTGGGVKEMSEDHKPYNTEEQTRIEKAGGSVTMRRVNGDLAVSRALGDYVYKHRTDMKAEEQQVSAEPEIRVQERSTEADQLLVLACDGIWDVMSNEEAGTYLLDSMRKHSVEQLHMIAEKMLDDCLDRGSRDNMSVVLVAFPAAPFSATPFKEAAAAAPAPHAAEGNASAPSAGSTASL